MKKTLVVPALFFVSLLSMISCDSSSDSENDQITSTDINAIRSSVVNGDWRITFFFDTDKEETTNFTNFIFSFNDDGTLVATNGNQTVSGVWSVTDSNSSDDDNPSSSDVDFNIFFATPSNFEELSEDWDILEFSATTIKLTHVSGGNGGTDFLTFEK
ncbi:hypothetical protein U1E44_07090 [Arenibacter sp. GZD96]|uniref:hypothetical protein n=1 Tax=Aurantibrevibacter litoralis TaxID=3106030 RepID=UPI002AFF927B|nr:hypothetical protein [Arenibacter sp. GZD-96]MEA1785850.1 hypothetical protein [Arenibacter sp. GZD-96]